MSDNTTPITGAGFTPLPDEQSSSQGVPLAKIATTQIKISQADVDRLGIPEELIKDNPVLVDLVLKTESMKDDERKYWFQLLPIMTDEQVQKLQNILQNERDQLAELDAKYETEVSKLNEKHAIQWQADSARKKRVEIETKEKANEQEEQEAEKDILGQLENL